MPSEDSARKELEHLREQLLSGRGATDRAALADEYNRQTRAAGARCAAAPRSPCPVARASPYFGHLRLREDGEEWDVCLGNGTFIDGRGAHRRLAQRADLAPVLSLRQGETYEEEIAGRTRSGTSPRAAR